MNFTKYIKQLYLLTSLVLISFNLASQTVTLYTPNGSTVEAFYNTEMPSNDIIYYTEQYRNAYPQAEILANASATYNCHSYAWNLTEGGSIVCWLNKNPDLHKYWDDGSYVETTEGNAEKIFYYAGDHSAIVSSIPGKYDSKWGPMPLMRHAPDYGPTTYQMTRRNYYQKTLNLSISGASTLCYSGSTYLIDNLPSGATITWSSSNDISRISPQGSNPCVFKGVSGVLAFNSNISAVISYNGNTFTIEKEIQVGTKTPSFHVLDATNHQVMSAGNVGSSYYLTAFGSNLSSNSSDYRWEVIFPADPINGRIITTFGKDFTPTHSGYYVIKLQYREECGWSTTTSKTFAVTDNTFFLLYPNPTSNNSVTVEQTDDSSRSFTDNYMEITLYDYTMNVRFKSKVNSKRYILNTSSLKRGLYYIHIRSGNKYGVQKLVIE